MKTKIIASLILGLGLMFGCENPELENTNFEIGSDYEGYNAEEGTITADYERNTFVINVDTESASAHWEALCPTNDIWCSFTQKSDQLIVTLADNFTDDVRETYIILRIGDNEKRIDVSQDYYRYINLNLADNTTLIGAARATITMPVQTNIKSAIATDSEDDWISEISFENGVLSFDVTRNESMEDQRTGYIDLSAEGASASLKIIQNELSGYNYEINLSGVDFSKSFVYEITDPAHANRKVGQICQEYLYKVNEQTQEVIVRKRAVVVYPYTKDGVLDLQNGFVLDDGGRVVWNTAATTGYNVMSNYIAGTLTEAPTTIYFPAGASMMTNTFTPEEGDDIFTPTITPYVFTDTRSGAANTQGETTETFEYKIVKIGVQYWQAENLKTSRFRNGEPIPTNITNAQWTGITTPGCLISGTGAANTYLDANDPAGTLARNEYGLLYNFPAIVNRTVGGEQALTGISDQLSAAGWAVPNRSDYELMINYVLQNAASTTNNALPELYAGATGGDWDNITGFGAKGTRSRGVGTGGFNTGTYYGTMNYEAAGSPMVHNYRVVRINSTGSIHWTHVAGVGDYVRCIKR